MISLNNSQPPVRASGLTLQLTKIADFPNTGGSPASRVQEVIDPVDGRDWLYATDTRGVVWVIDDGQARPQPFLDLRGRGDFEPGGGEAGLRSIAFHPDFQTPGSPGYGKVYASYTAPVAKPPGVTIFEQADGLPTPVYHSVVSEWSLVDPANPLRVDPSSKREVFRSEQPFSNHNTNAVVFNPNAKPGDADYGKLYIGVADGGGAFDPGNQSQNLSLLAGSIVRIDPLEQQNGAAYGIPADNPFNNVNGALPEIWAYGFRNPQALSFDSEGRLFASDIGQGNFEEINVVLRGGNHGWDVREGPLVLVNDRPVRIATNNADIADLQFPVTGYDREENLRTDPFGSKTAAVAGGFVYEGDAVPELRGKYIFGDFTRGKVYFAPIESLDRILSDQQIRPNELVQPRSLDFEVGGKPVTVQSLLGNSTGRTDSRFGVDEAGELYIFSKRSGDLWKITTPDSAATPAPPPPVDTPTPPPSAASFRLVYTETAERVDPNPLGGAEIAAGDFLYAFIDGNEALVDQVDFFFDGRPVKTESFQPFDLNGTSPNGSALGFPTDELSTGVHSVVAEIIFKAGGQIRETSVSETFSVVDGGSTGGTDTVAVEARGSQAEGQFAKMQLLIDGVSFGTRTVTATKKTYSFEVPTLGNADLLEIRFPNDSVDGRGNDRNLIVTKVVAGGEILRISDATYERDNKSDIDGQSGLWWNGELSFDLDALLA